MSQEKVCRPWCLGEPPSLLGPQFPLQDSGPKIEDLQYLCRAQFQTRVTFKQGKSNTH